MKITFSDAVFYFLIYSMIGWACEVVYCSIAQKKYQQRGFLIGPYCPIYGFGALAVIMFLNPLFDYPILVFLLSIIVTSLLEYITSWLMEKLFGIRWWDYSNKKFNINGRICLKNSLYFGILSMVLIYLMHPITQNFIGRISESYKRPLSSLILLIFFGDLLLTLASLLKLEEKLKKLEVAFSNYEGKISVDRLSKAKEASVYKITNSRLYKAFPNMKHQTFEEVLGAIENYIEEKGQEFKDDIEKSKASNEKFYQNLKAKFVSVGNTIKTKTINIADSFKVNFVEAYYSDIDIYKIFWIFFIAGVLGFVVETLFCLFTRGYIESRQGLLYGPFSQIYGVGAVFMILLLKPLEKKRDAWIFIGSAIIGGGFEYFSSLAQEKVFGTVSWEYSSHQFSIGDRTSILYMFFWGLLGILFIRGIYPGLVKLINRIPKKQGVFIAWVVMIALVINSLLSVAAVYRWSERNRNLAPSNKIEIIIDEQYPDEFMRDVYPNMMFVD